jgi:polyhydroxybutyrate depolymerase
MKGTRIEYAFAVVAILLLGIHLAGCGNDDSSMAPVPTGPVGGEERPVEVFLPSNYDPATPAPLLILLHSYTITGAFAETSFRLRPIADERGFIYAIPEGLVDNFMGGPFWNSTSGCCDFDRSNPDDSGYLRRVIEDIIARWNVDRRRIFTFGLSNGGFMGHRMACDHSDLVAGIVSIAGATHDDPSLCQPSHGVHILNIHGTEDDIIHFDGGVFTGPYPGAVETVERWVDLNECGPPEPGPMIDADRSQPGAETRTTLYTEGCKRGGSVQFWEMVGAGHYFFPTDEFKQVVFDYFLSHPKR